MDQIQGEVPTQADSESSNIEQMIHLERSRRLMIMLIKVIYDVITTSQSPSTCHNIRRMQRLQLVKVTPPQPKENNTGRNTARA